MTEQPSGIGEPSNLVLILVFLTIFMQPDFPGSVYVFLITQSDVFYC